MSDPDVGTALGELIGKLAGGPPPTGPFPPIAVALPWPERPGGATLAVGPLQDHGKQGESARRWVEVRVGSPSGDGHASRWVIAGTSGEVMTFLRSPEAAAKTLEAARALAEKADELR